MKGWPDAARNGLSTKAWHWVNDTIKVSAIDLADFTPTVSHDTRSDITAGVIAELTLTGKTVGTLGIGVAGHADGVFLAVSGDPFEQIVYWMDTGVASTSPIIIWNDDFPQVVPNGTNIGLIVPNGVYGINQVTP